MIEGWVVGIVDWVWDSEFGHVSELLGLRFRFESSGLGCAVEVMTLNFT